MSGEQPASNKQRSEDGTKIEDEEVLAGASEHPAQEKELRKRMTSAAAAMASTSEASAAQTSLNSSSGSTQESVTQSTERTEGQKMEDHKVVQDRKGKGRGSLLVKREPRPGEVELLCQCSIKDRTISNKFLV